MNLKHQKTLIVTFLVGIWLVSGCELLEEVGIVLNSKEKDFVFTIQANERGEYIYSEEDINSEIDSLVEANNYSVEQINKVTLKNCKLTVSSPDTATFNAMGSFRIIISKTTLEAGEVIARKDSVANGLTELMITPEQVDLTEYVKGDNYKIFVFGIQDEDVTTDILVDGVILYEVEVGF